MAGVAEDRLNHARELIQAAREEFARAEQARGGAAVIGLRNSCGKGFLVPEDQLPDTERGGRFFVAQHMNRDMRRAYIDLRQSFHIDGYYGGIVEFDDMSDYFNELEEFIEQIESLTAQE